MVVPERERPGATATAWARPTTSACHQEMPLRELFILLMRPDSTSDRHSSTAVTSRQKATVLRLSPKRISTLSLKNRPTTATGIIDTIILRI